MTTTPSPTPTPTPEVSFIRLSLFPASVQKDQTPLALSNVKAIVTDAYLFLATDSPTGPQFHTQEELISFEGNNKIGYTAVTPQGTYTISRSNGCGCGSRLRGFNPFRGKPYKGA